MIQKIVEYIAAHPQQLAEQIAAHIGISLFALLAATLIGIPCGCLAAKLHKGEALITAPFEMLRVVPSLAVLILLIPILGTGVPPAVTALTILAVPPVLLNTIVGFRTIPDFMIESARGIGMTEQELFWRVRVPCALPMVLAGLRTALVEVVASTTHAAKIGAGGLGEIIFTGLGLYRMDLLVLGGALVAVLSLASGWVFDVLSRRMLKYKYT